VVLGNWVGTDCDRHPDHRPGMISYIAILEKMKVLEGLDVKLTDEKILILLEKCINDLENNFDKEKFTNPKTEQYENILLSSKTEIDKLNKDWEDNLEKVRKIYTGSDYRISGDDLKDENSINYQIIKNTLVEIKKSQIDIQRFIIADCNDKKQIEQAKELIENHVNLKNLEIVPLFEDRIATNKIKEILKSGKNIKTIQIAGSDGKRRIGQIGIFALLSNITEAAKSFNNERKFKIFIGSGNTHWRTEDLSALIPQEYKVERTIQGQLFVSLSNNKELCDKFNSEYNQKLNERPTSEDLCEITDLLKDMDKKQKQYQDKHQSEKVFNKKKQSYY
jgi:hypothetical protein